MSRKKRPGRRSKPRRRATSSLRPARRRKPYWESWSDDELLELRMCDLGVAIEGTPLERRVAKLYAELERRRIDFKPHVWLSSEWFSPDGVPGIAIPFYLAHPRLMRLEARQMLEVEGGTAQACMRILRHEAGHAIDTAFRLHYKKRWREIFGLYSQRYPRYYRPNPNSRKHVVHLDAWYAQAHPAEDFAETFAVWLTPNTRWRESYRDWPGALRKLEYVHELMGQAVAGNAPRRRSLALVEPTQRSRVTLAEHYRRKRAFYGADWPDLYDTDLERLFSDAKRYAHRVSAAGFLRSIRAEARNYVTRYTGAHPYTVDQVLQDMIERCRHLHLRLAVSPRSARTQAMILVTVYTMNLVRGGRGQEIPL